MKSRVSYICEGRKKIIFEPIQTSGNHWYHLNPGSIISDLSQIRFSSLMKISQPRKKRPNSILQFQWNKKLLNYQTGRKNRMKTFLNNGKKWTGLDSNHIVSTAKKSSKYVNFKLFFDKLIRAWEYFIKSLTTRRRNK